MTTGGGISEATRTHGWRWFSLVQCGLIKPGVVEPPVPPGLGRLTASLRSLVEFFRLDHDLLTAAASASEPIERVSLTPRDLRAGIARVPVAKKDELLFALISGVGSTSVNPLLHDFVMKHKIGVRQSSSTTKRRTVGQIVRAAKK